ncbi:MAG: UDP-glucose 4-epimerase GalE [Alphaproteobacteria bacterium]|nr:UDP-glucose 4-epimerase GalE [Alphaproteobacteria bacterium]
MANILVTGGAGYIGSHTCKQLAASGHTPIVYDNLSNGHRDAVRWGPFEAGDITDGARLADVIRAHKPDAVIHFAGLIEVGISVVDPAAFYHTNVAGSLTLVRAMVDAGIGSIVFSSTAAIYGLPQSVPIPEDAACAPINPYGETKRTVEAMLGYFAAAHGLRYAALRYFNAAGADPDGDLGERHDPESHLIPLVLFAALGQRDRIDVYGTDYPTPDGTAVRDYAHVSDLAAAHVAALDYLAVTAEPLIANLGTGTGFSVRQVIDACRRVTGRDIPARDAPRRAGDPPQLVAAVERAHNQLGWRAQMSDLDTIVATAWTWHSTQSASC